MQTADARGRIHPAAEYNYQVVIRIGGRAGDVYALRRHGATSAGECYPIFGNVYIEYENVYGLTARGRNRPETRLLAEMCQHRFP